MRGSSWQYFYLFLLTFVAFYRKIASYYSCKEWTCSGLQLPMVVLGQVVYISKLPVRLPHTSLCLLLAHAGCVTCNCQGDYWAVCIKSLIPVLQVWRRSCGVSYAILFSAPFNLCLPPHWANLYCRVK